MEDVPEVEVPAEENASAPEVSKEAEVPSQVVAEPDKSDSSTRLVYTGSSASLVFEGVEFPYGVPVAADAALVERLAEHALGAEGHRLTLAE